MLLKKSVMAELQLNHGLVLDHRAELYNLNIIIIIECILIIHKCEYYIYRYQQSQLINTPP